MAGAALVNGALAALGIAGQPADVIYAQIDAIVTHLQAINDHERINVVVTGNISERLCRYGLEAAVAGPNGGFFTRMPRYWKWVGDFYLLGDPFNVIVSVKSFTARDRLLASGSGNLLSPTIGWGLFNEPAEFSYDRVVSYAYRGFTAIYAPAALMNALLPNVLGFTNINGNTAHDGREQQSQPTPSLNGYCLVNSVVFLWSLI
jgi:hypothetical protein